MNALAAPVPRASALPLLLAARVAATIAFQSYLVAIGWQMYTSTGRAVDLGLIGLCQFLPHVVLTLAVGQVLDRLPRRPVLQLSQALVAAALVALAFVSAAGELSRGVILTFVSGIACARAFDAPTQQALLPGVVTPVRLPRAIAWSSSAQKLGAIAGPALGGLLCTVGGAFAHAFSAGLFLLSTLVLFAVRPVRQPAERRPFSAADLFAGYAYVARNRLLLGAMSLELVATLLGGAVALFPIMARDVLRLDAAWGLGLLRSSMAVGALLSAVRLARAPIERRVGRRVLTSIALYGVATIVFGLSRWWWLSVPALVLVGAADMVSTVVRQSLVHLGTPDQMRGRVAAVNFTTVSASNQLGQLESGLTAAWLGPVGSIVLGGAGVLTVALLWSRLFPALARRDRLLGA